jgi:hypothetical protein
MIGMVMGDKHTEDITVVESHLTQVFLDQARRNAGIDQYAACPRTEIVTIAATTTRKTPEYESLFLHIT